MRRKATCAAAAMVALPLFAPAVALAAPPQGPVEVQLTPLNGTAGFGRATLTPTPDGGLRVQTSTNGLVPNQPHAAHLHGMLDGSDFTCPTPQADTNGDGFISTPEGLPPYGPIMISLTTSGDTSMDSGLTLDRFPIADPTGTVTYDRTIPASELPAGTIENLENLVVVQHGIDVDGNGQYNLNSPLGESQFAASMGKNQVPAEATFPANCGTAAGSSTT